MRSEPIVSVVIPAYNTRDCISRAIDSALAQDVSVEVIVVDDASLDGTADHVAEHYAADNRVKVIRAERNGGPSAARNIGFRAARGAWIALLDSDDWWKPGRLIHLLGHADEADFIADNIIGFDVVADTETGAIYPNLNDHRLHLADFIEPKAAKQHDFGYLQPLLRRTFLEVHEIAYRVDVRVGEDLLFNIDILASGARALFVGEAYYVYAMPVGLISRAASPHSRSTVDTEPLIAALKSQRQRYAHLLSEAETQAFSRRLAELQQRASVAAFHRARAKSNFMQMAKLLASDRQVRAAVVEKLADAARLTRRRER